MTSSIYLDDKEEVGLCLVSRRMENGNSLYSDQDRRGPNLEKAGVIHLEFLKTAILLKITVRQ